jgi:hypothetical protein
VLAGAIAAPASASVTVTSFTIRPCAGAGSATCSENTQAGSNPTIYADAKFSYSDSSDTVKNLSLALAPGLLVNPTAPTATCSQSQLNGNSCPSQSQVGTGSLIASTFVGNITATANLYIMPPPSSAYLSQIGLIGSAAGQTIKGEAPIPVSTGLNKPVTLSFKLSNLPNQAGGFSIHVLEITLNINGTVDSNVFTRNPTSCAPATSRFSASSYESSTASTASSSYTPTGCSSLTYAPMLAGTVKRDTSDSGVSLKMVVTETATQAATKTTTVKVPKSLTLRAAVVTQAEASTCGLGSLLSGCPVVGSSSATMPYLKTPLPGKVYLVNAGAGKLPGMFIGFAQPIPALLFGTTTVSSTGTSEKLPLLPDASITSFTVSLAGGTSSLFTGSGSCTGIGSLTGAFSSWSGVSVSRTAALACS